MSDVYQQALEYHEKYQGKLGTTSLVGTLEKPELALAYTPGVAEPCRLIAKDYKAAYTHTLKGRTVAVISDGSAVLGLGNMGALAGLPVMEGKALLIKHFGGVDAFPLVINAHTPEDIITFVKQVAPTFAGINLEDIAAPTCFEVEEALQDIGIPVFHDDQHGTAIVVRAALLNAAKVVGKTFDELKVVVVGSGAAGISIAKILLGLSCKGNVCEVIPQLKQVHDVILVDTQGALVETRTDLNLYKHALARVSNREKRQGRLTDVIVGADVVIGVSGPGLITGDMIATMNSRAIVFAMANPTPEIMPKDAKVAGAVIVATGRSDYPNQINNVLAFPGIFKAVINGKLERITEAQKVAASEAIADLIPHPTPGEIIPSVFYPNLAETVARAVLSAKK